MKMLIRASLFAGMLALPVAASAQNDAAPRAEAPQQAAGRTMMNCPMMADMGGMQKDLGALMSDVDRMIDDTKDAASKEHLQKMHGRMAAMRANLEKMGGMMGNRMGGMMPGAQQPPPAPTTPATPLASPQDHQVHQ